MRLSVVAAASLTVLALSIDAAHAGDWCPGEWFLRAEALARSLVPAAEPGGDFVFRPPGNIDPQMAIVPPRQGTMRLLIPPRP